ncbi:MAG: hypothetical protein K9H64_05610 [Bacteroidales bacterium]|nr:hypothetical protein [Bacteroidales bacterium]MCF8455777.1 hypothetical protein [Bacteroidales bacterium]
MNFHKAIKIFLISILTAILLFPLIDKEFGIIPELKLNGVFDLEKKPVLSEEGWFEGNYQSEFEKWLEQNIGLRPLFINIYNQFRFSLFKQASTATALIGKDNVLFQQTYVNAYMGRNFVGSPAIKENVRRMKHIQETLKENGKFFVYVIAPGKVSYFPEYLPDSVDLDSKDTTNYEVYAREFIEQGVNHIDFRKYFLQAKDTSRYPLYPKTGTHWSGYGAAIVADSLLRYIEEKYSIDMVDYTFKKGEVTHINLRQTDDDIEEGLNLAFNIPDWDMYYPEIEFGDTLGKDRPAILNIGDSYNHSFWGFYPFYQTVFKPTSRFWYYYKIENWPESNDLSSIHMTERDLRQELEKFNIVMILSTEANLYQKGYGFVDDAYRRYTKDGEELNRQREERIASIIRNIKGHEGWLNSVKEKAVLSNVDLETALRRDAVWMIEHTK